jgi:hypothetical protein
LRRLRAVVRAPAARGVVPQPWMSRGARSTRRHSSHTRPGRRTCAWRDGSLPARRRPRRSNWAWTRSHKSWSMMRRWGPRRQGVLGRCSPDAVENPPPAPRQPRSEAVGIVCARSGGRSARLDQTIRNRRYRSLMCRRRFGLSPRRPCHRATYGHKVWHGSETRDLPVIPRGSPGACREQPRAH